MAKGRMSKISSIEDKDSPSKMISLNRARPVESEAQMLNHEI
jgi:hypothetical protein